MEAKLIEETIKVSDDIRRKHMSLKRDLADADDVMKRTFKPIVAPLEKLVKQTKDKFRTKKIKLEEAKIEEIEQPEEAKELNENAVDKNWVKFLKTDTIAKSDPDLSLQDVLEDALTTNEGVDEIQNYLEQYGPNAKQYMSLYVTNDDKVDKSTYGLRYNDNEWKIGNAKVTIQNDDFEIDGKWYEGTTGLYELIFMKNPDQSKVTDKDLNIYREIVDKTNADRRNYLSHSQIRGSKSQKYKTYILRKKTGDGFKQLVKAKPHYVYWDDINELVDRLRLLIGSKNTGHTGHENEIHSIIEELREANVIE